MTRDEDIRAAKAEAWDEAVYAVFMWWQLPDGERPELIVNPYGVGIQSREGAGDDA